MSKGVQKYLRILSHFFFWENILILDLLFSGPLILYGLNQLKVLGLITLNFDLGANFMLLYFNKDLLKRLISKEIPR